MTKTILGMNKDHKSIEAGKRTFDKTYAHYKDVFVAFIAFEETAVDFFSDGDVDQRVLTHPSSGDM